MVKTVTAVSMAVVILFIGALFPMFINQSSGETNVETGVTINGTGAEDIDESLRVEVTDKTSSDVDLRLTSLETGESESAFSVASGETANFTLDGETLSVRVIDIESGTGGVVDMTVHYPATFGWDNDVTALSENLGVVFAGVALIIIVGMVGGVLN